ncbi:MAG: sensor histidine kinase [Candidatus Promineifilaceae bacterium]
MSDIAVGKISVGRLRAPAWLVLFAGAGLGLAVAAGVMIVLMRPPFEELAALVGTLAITSVLSLGVGYVLYRRGWARASSFRMKLVLTYVWAAVLTLVNVWVLAERMFVNSHDLTLAGILLLFAALIATTFGVFVAASVSDDLRHLIQAAGRLAAGELEARAEAGGRDEVGQLARAFNHMAFKLERADARRQEYETLRRDLVAWISHDLRTPLTSIRAMVEALNDGLVEDETTRARYYRTIQSEVMALNSLIDDLFELAQLDAGGLALERTPYSLRELLSDAADGFRPLAQQRQIDLRREVGPDLDPVLMNPARIGRVLNNLIGNALQHTPPGGEVVLSACRGREGVEVSVQDSGPGFSSEELPRVFEKFYRGEQARSRATGGAGLGLAIALGIVEAHGGRIWAENVPGAGARVGFILPA